jgi:hypothetical protein
MSVSEPTVSEEKVVTDFELGYCLGLIAGEGSFSYLWKYPCLTVKVRDYDPEMLKYLTRCFGGKVYGPYPGTGFSNGATIQWMLYGRKLARILPLLHKLPAGHKRRQFETWLVAHAAFFAKC